jgi:protein-L-isoaspartate O-methyltransferase
LVRCTCGSEKRFTESGLQKLKVKEGETVLEIGFGTGHALVALARLVGQSGKVYGEAGFRLVDSAALSVWGLPLEIVLRMKQ